MGAPHKRERLWIIAYPNGLRRTCLEEGKEIVGSGINIEVPTSWKDIPFDISLPVDEYDAEPVSGVLRVDDGLAEELDRIKLCGNGVCPQQSAPAWQRIKDLAECK